MKALFCILRLLLFLSIMKNANAQQCPAPFAKFTYHIASDGFTVSFVAESCDSDLDYSWDFGDGSSSSYQYNEQAPVHTYSFDDTYIVKMTVKNSCGDIYVQEVTIKITAGTPTTMWLDLTGPTIAAECQQVTYTANIVGGVPPYTYKWNFDDYFCSNCSGTICTQTAATTLTGGPSQTVKFDGAGISTFTVTVTDGRGTTVSETSDVTVKDAFANIEIRAIAEEASCGSFGVNSNILFSPDISPLSTFEYPTNYYWTFGDGTSAEDRHDGGGIVLKKYITPGNHTYTVTLNVCDPNGCMQTTKQISVCDPNSGGGGGGPKLEIVGHPNETTWVMDYETGTSWPSSAVVQMINSAGCVGGATYKWSADLDPDLGLPNTSLFYQASTLCGLAVEEGIQIDLFETGCWNSLLSTLPGLEEHKPWGCVDISAVKNCTSGVGNSVHNGNCLVYIQPDELEIGDFLAEGSCRDFTLTALIKGGGWKKAGSQFTYKEVLWKAYDTNDHELELTNIFVDVAGSPEKKKVNLDHPYFQQFGPYDFVEFMVKVTVNDFANGSVETNQLVAFNPFRLHLEDHYDRCPGVESPFSHDPLATGGSNYLIPEYPYVFTWSPASLTGENPTFTAPSAGATTSYSVTVTNGPGCSLTKTTSVTGTPLSLDLYPTIPSCESSGSRPIGPNVPVQLGGSGHYLFTWSAANPAHLAYLNATDISNPMVDSIPAGQTITYTLTVEDEYGGCTATDVTDVISFANDLSVSIADIAPVCYGSAAELKATGQPVVTGFGAIFFQYHWQTDNRNHDLSWQNGNYVPPTLPIGELANSYPGLYTYRVRYTNILTGCYAEDETEVRVQQNWTHLGYVPKVKSAVAGTKVPLWENNSNSISGINFTPIVSWSPFDATDIIPFTGNYAPLPKNGQFIPTTTTPYLTMKITDNVTGCSKDYKSQRYIISDQGPELWLSGDNPIICKGSIACFDVVFDAHLSNYATSLLPNTVKVDLKVYDPAYNAPNPLAEPIAQGSIHLTLVNSLGLYKGRYCTPTLDQSKPLSLPYNCKADLISDIWDVSSPIYEIFILDYSQHVPVSGCVNAGSGTKVDMGVNCSLTTNTHFIKAPQKTLGRDYIQINTPASGTSIELTTNDGSMKGPHLLISPCMTGSPPPPQNDSIPPSALTEARTVSDSSKLLQTQPVVTLEVFPNPFTGQVTIRYTVPSDCPGDVALYLRDFTGKQIKTIEQRKNTAPGAYQATFDGSGLPSGIYLYELVVCNGMQVVKKAEKISH